MIVERIFQHAHSQPNHAAVVWNDHAISYLRFAQGIATLRSAWRPLTPPPGSVVVVVVHSLLESWTAVLALQSLGLVTVCTRSLQEAEALGLDDSPAVVICSRKAAESRPWLTASPHAHELLLPADLYHRPVAPAVPALAGLSHQGGHILYTSGTTGSYKKLLQDNARDDQRCERRVAAEGLSEHTVWNNTFFGLWTAIGYGRPPVVWHAGGTMVFDQGNRWAENLGKHSTTHTTLMPSALDEVLRVLPPGPADAPRWSFQLSIGGGLLSPAAAREALARVTPRLYVNYACTELGQVMRSAVTDPADLHWLAPVGLRVTEIVSEDGLPCPEGVEGLLRVRPGPLDFDGYLDDAASTARVFRDGWFYPGDLAVRRADGRIRILGRSADVINVGGSKYATGPLEESLREALGVSGVCLFSDPAATGKNLIAVVLEASEPPSQARWDAAIRLLPGNPTVCVYQVARFPHASNGTGKVDRRSLRQRIAQIATAA